MIIRGIIVIVIAIAIVVAIGVIIGFGLLQFGTHISSLLFLLEKPTSSRG